MYLNEADEWSRRLVTCLQEWALELHEPLPDTAVALSHSLAGSSATVGFTALSEMARVLEHTLQHVQLQSGGTEEQAAAFMAAAEDIRRLLHQFAAGFLKEPSPEVLAQLRQSSTLVIAGEASSHCVRASTEHIVENWGSDDFSRIVLLTDCMSPVGGFEQAHRDFLQRMRAIGVRCETSASFGL